MHFHSGCKSLLGLLGGIGLAAAAAVGLAGTARAQSAPANTGLYLEAEGQRVFGASGFDAGLAPDLFSGTIRDFDIDDGDGWGGAISIGYGWASGWSGTVRYRRIETDDSKSPTEDVVLAFAAGDPMLPGGYIVGIVEPKTETKTETSIVDLQIGRDVALLGMQGQIYGGVTYVSVDRDSALIDTCSCDPLLLKLSSSFQGAGPKIGFRGGLPIANGVRLVGGASAAAVIGTAEFKSTYIDPLAPQGSFKDDDTRVAVALDGEAGLAFGIGAGTFTFGYRVDALLGALDTNQRVSAIFTDTGFPTIGDDRDDFVNHGPFAKFSLPLSGGAD